MREFNILYFDFNKTHPEPYNVLPFFRREYQDCRKKDKPVTKEQWTEFVKRKGQWRFWGDCNYEMIVSKWPPTEDKVKVSVWEQIEPNIDLIVDILMDEVKK